MSSELKKMTISGIMFSILIISGFSFYTSLANSQGISTSSLAGLNETKNFTNLGDELNTKAGSLREEDVGGFSVIRGGVTIVNVLGDTVGIVSGVTGNVLVELGFPQHIINGLQTIIIIIGVLSLFGLIWAKVKP